MSSRGVVGLLHGTILMQVRLPPMEDGAASQVAIDKAPAAARA
jgi:hypothetical protein